MTTSTISYIDGADGDYRPGSCNLRSAEIAQRRRVGWLGIGASIAFAIVLLAVDAPAAARLLVVLPLAGGFVGLVQARRRFCVGYALAGRYNVTDEMGTTTAVPSREARMADLWGAVRVGITALVPAALLAVAFAALQAAGIDSRDITTANFMVNPRYDYGQNGTNPPKIVAYDVSNMVNVTVRKLDSLGQLLEDRKSTRLNSSHRT